MLYFSVTQHACVVIDTVPLCRRRRRRDDKADEAAHLSDMKYVLGGTCARVRSFTLDRNRAHRPHHIQHTNNAARTQTPHARTPAHTRRRAYKVAFFVVASSSPPPPSTANTPPTSRQKPPDSGACDWVGCRCVGCSCWQPSKQPRARARAVHTKAENEMEKSTLMCM